MPVGRIVMLALGLDVELGQLRGIAEHISDTGELLAAYTAVGYQSFAQSSEVGEETNDGGSRIQHDIALGCAQGRCKRSLQGNPGVMRWKSSRVAGLGKTRRIDGRMR